MDLIDQTPASRSRGVFVEELEGETLIYDRDTHEAHCLNPTAAWVWRRLDGRASVAELAAELAGAADGPVRSEEDAVQMVWLALEELRDAGLLEGEVRVPPSEGSVSRREALRRLGRAAGLALLLPAVASVRAPVAAQAASCITKAQCKAINPRNPADCTGLPICNRRRRCCTAEVEIDDGVVEIECEVEKC